MSSEEQNIVVPTLIGDIGPVRHKARYCNIPRTSAEIISNRWTLDELPYRNLL